MITNYLAQETRTTFRCIGCGKDTSLFAERSFKCAACGNLLQVHHEFPRLLQGDISELKDVFDQRAAPRLDTFEEPDRISGVWRFRELVMPSLPDEHVVTLGEGIVPIVWAGLHLRDWVGGDLELSLILEGQGPTGSFKDFGGTVMVSVAKAAGVKAIGCASTGDTSAMAAAYAAKAGLQCFVLLPEGKVTPVQLMQPAAYGARVITVPGDFDACMHFLKELVEKWGVYPANSINPTRIAGHQATVFLIAQARGWILPDWIAVPVGNGSNSSSVGKAMRTLKRLGFVEHTSRILGCQASAAAPLHSSWTKMLLANEGTPDLDLWCNTYRAVAARDTIANAIRIGDPVSREKVMREIIWSMGAMEVSSEVDLIAGMHACARDGYLVCPQTGVALAGIRNAVRSGVIKPGANVAVVSTATGLKFAGAYESCVLDRTERATCASAEAVAEVLSL